MCHIVSCTVPLCILHYLLLLHKENTGWFSIAMFIACINYFDDSILVHHICARLLVPSAQTAASECVASKVTPEKFQTNFDLIHMWGSF